jgi:transposase-like protein
MKDKFKHNKKGKFESRYTEAFKRKVIEEYLETGSPKERLLVKYGIAYKGAFQAWMPKLGYVDIRRLPKPAKELAAYTMMKPRKDNAEVLQRRIKELERELEDEKLRSEAYARLIELAEREQGISIRKKDNTK